MERMSFFEFSGLREEELSLSPFERHSLMLLQERHGEGLHSLEEWERLWEEEQEGCRESRLEWMR